MFFIDDCSVEISNLTDSDPIYVTSPNYNLGLPYPNNVDCVWLFTDFVTGTYIITIIDLSTEWWDLVSVGFGVIVTEESQGVLLRGWAFPSTILVPHLNMWLRFTSNHAVGFRGFLAEVERRPGTGKTKIKLYVLGKTTWSLQQ